MLSITRTWQAGHLIKMSTKEVFWTVKSLSCLNKQFKSYMEESVYQFDMSCFFRSFITNLLSEWEKYGINPTKWSNDQNEQIRKCL